MIPSWARGRGNHCETCVSWSKDKYIPYCGTCTNAASMDSGETTDSRYRCPSFQRRQEPEPYDRDGYGEGSDGW